MTFISVEKKEEAVKHSKPLERYNKPLKSDCGASPCNCRAERTPGAVAVSGIYGRELAGAEKPLPASPKQTQGGCGAWAILSECSSGLHHFGKRIVCGKEWCLYCGKDNSPAHKRRQARILPKVQQISQLGYFVIEFPDIYRHLGQAGVDPDPEQGWCYSKQDLRTTTSAIVEVLAGKRMGRRGRVGGYFSRGLIRWHYFGEKKLGKWNPHANVLVDGAFIEPDKLEAIKTALRDKLNIPDLIVNYSFTDKPGKMVHSVRYVTRSTFKHEDWNPYMAQELFNFRNQRWWGKWQDEPAWELSQAEAEGEDVQGLTAVSSLQTGICPDCGQPLKTLYHSHTTGQPVQWTRPVDSTWLAIWGAEEISGSGYYRIPHKEWNGGERSPGVLMRLEQMEAEARKKPSVLNVAVLARQRLERKLRAFNNEEWWDDVMENPGQHGG